MLASAVGADCEKFRDGHRGPAHARSRLAMPWRGADDLHVSGDVEGRDRRDDLGVMVSTMS
ncbi:hypothetical protein JCM18909_2071 [Cutibacterium acnes JCM 18909]|nr:hypothetical protein JCM18909_2071 [Cutibacterium acnes JCM 18909]